MGSSGSAQEEINRTKIKMQSQDPMESIRSAVDHADKNPSKVVSYSWYLVLVSKKKAETLLHYCFCFAQLRTLVLPFPRLTVWSPATRCAVVVGIVGSLPWFGRHNCATSTIDIHTIFTKFRCVPRGLSTFYRKQRYPSAVTMCSPAAIPLSTSDFRCGRHPGGDDQRQLERLLRGRIARGVLRVGVDALHGGCGVRGWDRYPQEGTRRAHSFFVGWGRGGRSRCDGNDLWIWRLWRRRRRRWRQQVLPVGGADGWDHDGGTVIDVGFRALACRLGGMAVVEHTKARSAVSASTYRGRGSSRCEPQATLASSTAPPPG